MGANGRPRTPASVPAGTHELTTVVMGVGGRSPFFFFFEGVPPCCWIMPWWEWCPPHPFCGSTQKRNKKPQLPPLAPFVSFFCLSHGDGGFSFRTIPIHTVVRTVWTAIDTYDTACPPNPVKSRVEVLVRIKCSTQESRRGGTTDDREPPSREKNQGTQYNTI